MCVAALPAVRRAVDRVAEACAAHVDARVLRIALLDEIRLVVPFDGHVWVLTDPVTEVGSAPVARVPFVDDAELPRLIRAKYLSATNRWTTLDRAASLAATSPVGASPFADLLALRGVGDVASVVFRDRCGCWGFLDLWRAAPGVIAEAELDFLTAIVGDVTAAVRRCQADAFAATGGTELGAGPAVLMLSRDLEVRSQTPAADQHLRTLVPPAPHRDLIPAAALNVAAQLLAVEAGVDDHPPWSRVHLGGGTWLTLRAGAIRPQMSTGDGEIAVALEPTAPLDRADLYVRACGLSQREAELVRRLVAGLDTTGVARALHLSEHTVHDHLRSIFAKTGVRTRAALVARALGAHE